MLDPSSLTGQYITHDGTILPSSSTKLTPPIEIKDGETLYCFPSRNSTDSFHALFDTNGNIIIDTLEASRDNNSMTNNTGEDCYVRFSLNDSPVYQVTKDPFSPYLAYSEAYGYIASLSEVIFPPHAYGENDLIIKKSFIGNSTYNSSEYIPVKSGAVVKSEGQVSSGYPVVEVYDVHKNLLKTGITTAQIHKMDFIMIDEDGFVRFQSYNDSRDEYDPNIQFRAIISYNHQKSVVSEDVNDLMLYDQTDFAPTFGIKAFKQLNYEGEHPNYSYVLWNDTIKDDFYLSKNATSERKKIFTWDTSLSDGEDSGMYSAIILPNGDILFVYRTEFAQEVEVPTDSIRKNPIIYSASDGFSAHVIDFGDALKPSGWLQNIGAHYSYRYNRLYISEYTRPNSPKARAWTVDMPVTTPENWKIAFEREVGTMKHLHTAQEDPYYPVLYASSGDSNTTSFLWYSLDGGDTYHQVDDPSQSKYRMLNMVFTPDYVYWATDHWKEGHIFWRAARGEDGVIDPATLTNILTFDYEPTETGAHIATYSNVYLECYNAILFLDRADTDSVSHVPIRLYDIEAGQLYDVAKFYPLAPGYGGVGFRNEAVLIYPKDNKVVVGWGKNYRNFNKALGNTTNVSKHINNMILTITKNHSGYKITYDTVY